MTYLDALSGTIGLFVACLVLIALLAAWAAIRQMFPAPNGHFAGYVPTPPLTNAERIEIENSRAHWREVHNQSQQAADKYQAQLDAEAEAVNGQYWQRIDAENKKREIALKAWRDYQNGYITLEKVDGAWIMPKFANDEGRES